jgi:hypothetical protein
MHSTDYFGKIFFQSSIFLGLLEKLFFAWVSLSCSHFDWFYVPTLTAYFRNRLNLHTKEKENENSGGRSNLSEHDFRFLVRILDTYSMT